MRREEVLFHFRRMLGAKPTFLSPDVAEQLCLYDWPLNVREVIQLAERTKAIHEDVAELGLQHLPERIATFSTHQRAESTAVADSATVLAAEIAVSDFPPSARDQLAQDLAQALRESGGNVSLAAKKTGCFAPDGISTDETTPGIGSGGDPGGGDSGVKREHGVIVRQRKVDVVVFVRTLVPGLGAAAERSHSRRIELTQLTPYQVNSTAFLAPR